MVIYCQETEMSDGLWPIQELEARHLSGYSQCLVSAAVYVITSFCSLCISLFSTSCISMAKYVNRVSKNGKSSLASQEEVVLVFCEAGSLWMVQY